VNEMSEETFTKEQTKNAIQSFLDYGENSFGKCQKGYFSGGGWASRCLRAHLKDLKALQIAVDDASLMREALESIPKHHIGESHKIARDALAAVQT